MRVFARRTWLDYVFSGDDHFMKPLILQFFTVNANIEVLCAAIKTYDSRNGVKVEEKFTLGTDFVQNALASSGVC